MVMAKACRFIRGNEGREAWFRIKRMLVGLTVIGSRGV